MRVILPYRVEVHDEYTPRCVIAAFDSELGAATWAQVQALAHIGSTYDIRKDNNKKILTSFSYSEPAKYCRHCGKSYQDHAPALLGVVLKTIAHVNGGFGEGYLPGWLLSELKNTAKRPTLSWPHVETADCK
jgi:hypothetical protein